MSATVRPMGPLIEKNESGPGAEETRLRDGLMPYEPHHDDGLRIDPPPSEPCEIGHSPATSADAAPPDEPPHERSRSQGLRPGGYAGGSLTFSGPNSGATVLPRMTKPARRIFATTSSSRSGMRSLHAAVPCVVRMPAVSFRSLIEIGTPWNGGSSAPSPRAFSATPSGVEREVRRNREVRAEPRIDALDALQVELGELDGRHLAPAHHRGLIECRDEREIVCEIVTHSTQQYCPLDLL